MFLLNPLLKKTFEANVNNASVVIVLCKAIVQSHNLFRRILKHFKSNYEIRTSQPGFTKWSIILYIFVSFKIIQDQYIFLLLPVAGGWACTVAHLTFDFVTCQSMQIIVHI